MSVKDDDLDDQDLTDSTVRPVIGPHVLIFRPVGFLVRMWL
jgi:hypothetical protein